jgi:lipid II:glycine glycyltransferase (peptidoglycan interpeptide bridge formation enzyme)
MLDISISRELEDPEWDAFLQTMPDTLFQQSTMWAKVYLTEGWSFVRVVAKKNTRIVGGAQILLRPIRYFGYLGYIPKGPVIMSNDQRDQDVLLDHLDIVSKLERIRFLKIHLPAATQSLGRRLANRKAQLSTWFAVELATTATARVDLRPGLAEILKKMSRNRRRSITKAERNGIVIREGGKADMEAFIRLIKIHSGQKGYEPKPSEYFLALYHSFSHHFRLFVAEYKQNVLAMLSCIVFGDVIKAHHMGDSLLHKDLNAQSLLCWKAMLYGKTAGCNWFDFYGIVDEVGKAIERGEPFEHDAAGLRGRFKMSFGSKLTLRQGVYDISFFPPKRITLLAVQLLVKIRRRIKRLQNMIINRH